MFGYQEIKATVENIDRASSELEDPVLWCEVECENNGIIMTIAVPTDTRVEPGNQYVFFDFNIYEVNKVNGNTVIYATASGAKFTAVMR